MARREHPSSPKPAPVVPTLGVLELSSIAKGLFVCDAMLKKAQVQLLRATPVGSGKFLAVLTGDEASLRESVDAGLDASDPFLVSWTLIPNLHPQVLDALHGRRAADVVVDAVGILEATALGSLVRAADLAAKMAAVRILELTFDLDMGGKGYFTLTGPLAEVEAALEAAEDHLRREDAFVHMEIMPRPHEHIGGVVLRGLENLCFSRG